MKSEKWAPWIAEVPRIKVEKLREIRCNSGRKISMCAHSAKSPREKEESVLRTENMKIFVEDSCS